MTPLTNSQSSIPYHPTELPTNINSQVDEIVKRVLFNDNEPELEFVQDWFKHISVDRKNSIYESIARDLRIFGDTKSENIAHNKQQPTTEAADMRAYQELIVGLYFDNYLDKDLQKLIEDAHIDINTPRGQIALVGIYCSEIVKESNRIDNFASRFPLRHIEDEQDRELIACMYALARPNQLVEQLDEFNISDARARFRIAKDVASSDASLISTSIKKFNIKNERERIAIALRVAKQEGSTIAQYIGEYDIKDQDALIRIAKLSAQHNGKNTSKCILNFGITDREALVEIAKLASQNNPYETALYLDNYKIEDPHVVKNLIGKGLIAKPGGYGLFLKYIPELNNFTKYLRANQALGHREIESNIFEMIGFTNDQNHSDKTLIPLSPKLIDIAFSEDIYRIMELASILAGIKQCFDRKEIEILLPIVEQIIFLHNPSIRKSLFQQLSHFTNDHITDWSKIGKSKPKDKKSSYEILPHILLTILQRQGVDSETINLIATHIKTTKTTKKNLVYKDAKMRDQLLLVLQLLITDKHISSNDKTKIIKYIANIENKEDVLTTFGVLIGIRELGNSLTNLSEKEINRENLGQTLKSSLESAIGVLQNIDNFDEKLAKALLNFRYPEALFAYIGAAMHSNMSEMKEAINLFLTDLINETHAENRYLNSPHLKKICDSDPKFLNTWRLNSTTPLQLENVPDDIEVSGWTMVETDDPIDLFLSGTEIGGSCQNAIVSGGLGDAKNLLGYVLDGKARLIGIKSPEGKLRARAILRVLIDNKGKPALLLEKIYPPYAEPPLREIPHSVRDAIIKTAIEKAAQLGYPLYSYDTGLGSKCDVSLSSISCRAPYEYVDEPKGVGHGTTGVYTTKGKDLLYTPQQV